MKKQDMHNRRILYVIHRFWPYMGGAERYFLECAKRSMEDGFDVTVFTTDAWDIEYLHDKRKRRVSIREERFEGIRIVRFGLAHVSKQPLICKVLSSIPFTSFEMIFGYPFVLLPRYVWTMFRMRTHYDLVNAGVFPHNALIYPAYRYAKRQSIPFVCTPLLHLGEPHSREVQEKYLSRRQLELLSDSDAIVTATYIENRALESKGIDADKIHTVGIGINPDKVRGGVGVRFREKFKTHGKIVLQLSTQTHDKGSHHIVEAMKLLWHKGIEASLVMIGQVMDDFDHYFFQQEPWVYERTFVLEYVDEQTKKDALDACSVLTMASKADSFGIVYLEAWAYKKPVIGAYAGGVPGVIDDGENGFLVPFGDVHMLSEYLMLLLNNESLAIELGENGYQRVVNEFTWNKRYRALQQIYEGLLTHRPNC